MQLYLMEIVNIVNDWLQWTSIRIRKGALSKYQNEKTQWIEQVSELKSECIEKVSELRVRMH